MNIKIQLLALANEFPINNNTSFNELLHFSIEPSLEDAILFHLIRTSVNGVSSSEPISSVDGAYKRKENQ